MWKGKENCTCCHRIKEYEENYKVQKRHREKTEIKTGLCAYITHCNICYWDMGID